MIRKNAIKYLILLNALACLIKIDRGLYASGYYYEVPVQMQTELVIHNIPAPAVLFEKAHTEFYPDFSRSIYIPSPVRPLIYYNNFVLNQIKIYSFIPRLNIVSFIYKHHITHQSPEEDPLS